MNALVGVRNNTTGQLSPSAAVRSQVEAKLSQTSDARAGLVARADASVSISSVGASTATESGRTFGGQLDKDAFLQLLVLQMQNQNPLDPIDNGQMLGQLAQFSALEGLNNLNESFERLSSNVDQLNFISASQLLGRVVEGVDLNGKLLQGTVEGVHLDGSIVVLTVDGQFMSMAGIIRIEDGSSAN